MRTSDLPIEDVLVLLLGPVAQQRREGGLVDDLRNGAVHLPPHVGEGRLGLAARLAPALRGAFDGAQHLSHGQRFGEAREKVAALRAAAGFDESSLLHSRQDDLEKLLGDLLAAGNIGDSDRLARAGGGPGGKKTSRGVLLFYLFI